MSADRKGKDFEREIVRLLKPIWKTAHRGRQSGNNDASTCPDVDGTPLWIQCKREKKKITWNYYFRLEEDNRDKAEDNRPVAVIGRTDNDKTMVLMELQSLMKLLGWRPKLNNCVNCGSDEIFDTDLSGIGLGGM